MVSKVQVTAHATATAMIAETIPSRRHSLEVMPGRHSKTATKAKTNNPVASQNGMVPIYPPA